MDKRILLTLVLPAFVIAAIIFAAYYETQQSKKSTLLFHGEADKSCDLQKKTCSLNFPNFGEVALSLEPKPIPLVQNINIKVKTSVMDTEKVVVDFKGTKMNMGPNNITLNRQHTGDYTGNGMLPVCIHNTMEWQAEVYVQTKKGIIVAPFIFETHKQ